MTTLADRPNAALVVIDVQRGVVGEAHARDEVIGTIATLVEEARGAGVPVIWVQHSDEELAEGTEPWELVADLRPTGDEVLVHKHYGDAFEGTDLEAHLAALGVGLLYIAGAQTDMCVRSTLHGACTRGYDTMLVSDAHTTEDLTQYGAPPPEQVIAHTNLYWQLHTAPGRTAGAVRASDVDFKGGD